MKLLKHYLKWLLLTPLTILGMGLAIGIFMFSLIGWVLLLLGYIPWWGWLIWWACAGAVGALVSYDFAGDEYSDPYEDGL